MKAFEPSAVYDSGATSSCGREVDPFERTGESSTKIFQVPTGELAVGSERAKLLHPLRDPATEVDVVPAMTRDTLISTGKFADAGYVSVFDKDGVRIYDGTSARIDVSKEAILKGWRCPETGLFWIPLKPVVTNFNTDTMLMDKERSRLIVESRPQLEHAINNVYELPSTAQSIRYLHAAAGFPTKQTWLKAIRAGNFVT